MPRPVRLAVLIALAGSAAYALLNFVAIGRDPAGWADMRILFSILDRWWAGQEGLYQAFFEQQGVPGLPYYRYPAAWGLAMVPLIELMPLRPAIAVWGAASVATLIGGVVAVLRYLGVSPLSPRGAAVFVLLAVFGPLYETFYGPTKDLMMVGLIAFTFVLAERRRPWLAGLCFAGAIAMKIYPVFLGVHFLLRRDLRTLIATAVWFVVLNLLPLPWVGVGEALTFYTHVLPMSSASSASSENAGIELLLMATQWLSWFDHGLGPLRPERFPAPAAWVWRASVLVAFCWTSLKLQRLPVWSDAASRFLLFSSWCAAMLVLIPVSWVNYQIFLALPLLAMTVRLPASGRDPLRIALAAVFFAAVVMMSIPFKSVVVGHWVDPRMQRSERTATTLAEEMEAEFRIRVGERSARLATVRDDLLPGPTPAATRQRLRDLGIPDAGAASERHHRLAIELERLAATPRSPARDADLARRRAELRTARLTNRRVVTLMLTRAVAGVLAFLGVLGTTATLLRRA